MMMCKGSGEKENKKYFAQGKKDFACAWKKLIRLFSSNGRI